MMEKELKKSAVDLTELAIGLIVLGIVVSIGAYILVTMRDTHLTDLSVVTTSNETITGSNSTGTNLANAWGKSVLYVTNATGGELLTTTNYTTSVSTEGAMNVLTTPGSTYQAGSLNVTYQWYNTSSRADYTLSQDASVGLGEYGNWFKILVIVGVAAVVLALIFMAFGNRSSSAGIGGEY